jgi:hypothetical protein
MSVKSTVKTSQPLSGNSQKTSQKEEKTMGNKIQKTANILVVVSFVLALVSAFFAVDYLKSNNTFEMNAVETAKVEMQAVILPLANRLTAEKKLLIDINKLYLKKERLMHSARAESYGKATQSFLAIRQSLEGVAQNPKYGTVVTSGFSPLLTDNNLYKEPLMVSTPQGRNFQGLNYTYRKVSYNVEGLNNLKHNIKKYQSNLNLTLSMFNKASGSDIKEVSSLFDLIRQSGLKAGSTDVATSVVIPTNVDALPTDAEIDAAIANFQASQQADVSHLYVLSFSGFFFLFSLTYLTISIGYIRSTKEKTVNKLNEERKEILDYVEAILPSAIKDEEYVAEEQESFYKEKAQDPIQLYTALDTKINQYNTELENLQLDLQVEIDDLNKLKYKVEVAQAFDQTESYRDMYSVAVSIEKAIVEARKKVHAAEDDLTAAKRAEKAHSVKGATRSPAVRLESAKMKLEGLEKDLKEQKALIAIDYSDEQQSHMNEFLAKCKELDIGNGSTAYFQQLVEKKEDEIKTNIESLITEVSDKIANAVLEKEQLAEKTPEIYEQIAEDTETSKQVIYDLETIKRMNKESGLKVEEIDNNITAVQSVKLFDIKGIIKMFKVKKKVTAKTA